MLDFIKKLLGKRRYNLEDEEIRKEATHRANEIKAVRYETRLAEHQRQMIRERQKLQMMRDEVAAYNEDTGTKDNSLEQMFMALLLGAFAKDNPQLAQITQGFVTGSDNRSVTSKKIPLNGDVDLTDAEIRATLVQIPRKYLKLGRNMPNEALKGIISKQGNYSENTIERAIEVIKSGEI